MEKRADDIKMIREMMEKSSKFLSLSGLTGVIAGMAAILGAAFAYFYLLRDPSLTDYSRMQETMILLADALIVLLVSVGSGIYLSVRKAKKNNQPLFNKVTLRTIYSLAIPLLTGGIFALIYLFRGDISIVVSSTLIFYGLALVNVSRYTYGEVHYLGLTEIVLGLLAAIFVRNGIIFWTIGFGVCHIIYGFIMYKKYDLKKDDESNS
jgi:FtsH-binding integral membrane protein